MILPDKKTKIICTIGPASQSQDVIEQMITNGMNIARINFAHGDLSTHTNIINRIHSAVESTGERVAIMGGLPGPKIRIGQIASGPIELIKNQPYTLQTDEIIGDSNQASVSFKILPDVVHPGDDIFLNDGYIQLEVEEVRSKSIRCIVIVGGELDSFKGINLPGIDLGICAFTDQDRKYLHFAKQHEIDAISQSFVQNAADIEAVRLAANEIDYHPFIIAKIERSAAVDNLEEILKASDGIMVARGDLGVEIPIENIALTQKYVIEKSNIAGKPVITATHMLEAMVKHRRPTRAEATDVANAILDGTDCVMLSGETAVGSYPAEAVDVMKRIARVTEPHSNTRNTAQILEEAKNSGDISTEDLISLSIFLSVEVLNPIAVIIPTWSGATARRVSRFRLPVWIISVSPNKSTCNSLQFSYGVQPILEDQRPKSWQYYAREIIEKYDLSGTLALLTKGTSSGHRVGTNEIEIIDLTSPPSDKVIW